MKTKAYAALIFVSLVWGTTFLAIKWGVQYFPPFWFAGSRQFISGLFIILMAFSVKQKWDTSRSNIVYQSFVGFLLITLGNGLVTMGEQWVNSGVAALICSLMPMIAVSINLIWNKNEKINGLILLGMLIAFFGVLLIFKDNIQFLNQRNFIVGIVLIGVATLSWALGSVISRKRNSVGNAIFNSGIQVTSGGLLLLIAGISINEKTSFHSVPDVAWWSFVYLIVFGSVLAYTAYMYILKHLPVGLATSYAYINPLVAVIIGWALDSEPLTFYTIWAFLFIAGGVYLVNMGYRRNKKLQ